MFFLNETNVKAVFIIVLVCLIAVVCSPHAIAAVDKVICVPWQGDINKYHTTWDGQQIYLKGVVKTTTTDRIWYKWNFGDGTESSIISLTGKIKYNLEINHTYTGSEGTPFTAQLIVADNDALVNPITDAYFVKIEAANLDSKINVAIDNGLWYLYKTGNNTSTYYHSFDGSSIMVWSYGGYFASPTASAVHAFQINGHKQTGDPDEDPFVESVAGGLNWLFNGYYYSTSYPMLKSYNITNTPLGDDPDMRPNNKGIEVRDYQYRPVYQGGMVMDAIIAAGTPEADCGRDFDGDGSNETYREVLQDMIDQYAWGQYDAAAYGGWRYNWNSFPDNSACQWAAIGMIPAQESPWNCMVPDWVKAYNDNWLNYSHYQWNWDGTQNIWGGFGYTSAGWGDALTPSGMVQLAFVGTDTDDPRWIRTERWFADNWKDVGRDWLDKNNVYAYYAFAKAMRLAQPLPVVNFTHNNFDWYRGNGSIQGLAEKISDRLVASSYWDYYGPVLGTAWSVIILKPVLFAEAPVACFDSDPNPSYPDTPINFDPRCSTHSEQGKDITNLTSFEWDWDNDGIYETSTAAPAEVTNSFSCAAIPCTYPVTLRVADDSDPARTASYVMNIQITNPPHPPVARANGPYLVSLCPSDTLTLDGSRSYDPDEGVHEAGCDSCLDDTVIAWDWDLSGAPWDFSDASGETLLLESGYTAYFGAAGKHDVGLKVTDNTETSFPLSGEPNLTDETFAKLDVYDGCICEVNTVPGCGYVTLSWTNVGADIYYIYKSTDGINTGFEEIGNTTATNKTIGSFVMAQNTYYRVMAVTGESKCLSKAVSVYAEPELCNPTADPDGPYTGCINQVLTFDGSGSTAQTGTIVAWEWDVDNDGEYDDTFGETATWTPGAAGTYIINLKVTSSDSLILTDEASTTAIIEDCDPPICGDLNNDGNVDGVDRNILRGAFRSCTEDPGYIEEADYDENGCINYTDYQLWYQCYKDFNAPF